ncbi:MAG: hypothetical protein ACE5IK_11590 [Acidobacteriota bacterium]
MQHMTTLREEAPGVFGHRCLDDETSPAQSLSTGDGYRPLCTVPGEFWTRPRALAGQATTERSSTATRFQLSRSPTADRLTAIDSRRWLVEMPIREETSAARSFSTDGLLDTAATRLFSTDGPRDVETAQLFSTHRSHDAKTARLFSTHGSHDAKTARLFSNHGSHDAETARLFSNHGSHDAKTARLFSTHGSHDANTAQLFSTDGPRDAKTARSFSTECMGNSVRAP